MPEQKSVQIKICGITGKEEIRWLNEEDVSYAGFVLYEKSSRYVPIRKVSELFEELNENIKKVAVTVSPDVKLVEQIMDAGFDILQVHGSLTEDFCMPCLRFIVFMFAPTSRTPHPPSTPAGSVPEGLLRPLTSHICSWQRSAGHRCRRHPPGPAPMLRGY